MAFDNMMPLHCYAFVAFHVNKTPSQTDLNIYLILLRVCNSPLFLRCPIRDKHTKQGTSDLPSDPCGEFAGQILKM